MLDGFSTPVEDFWPRLQSLRHAIKRVLVFEARDSANIPRTAWTQRASAAGACIAVIDFLQFAQLAFADRRQFLPGRTNIGVARRVVAELVLAEKAIVHRRAALRFGNIGRDPRLFAGLDVLGFEVAAIG